MVVGTSVTAARHTLGQKRKLSGSPGFPTSAKFKVICQDPQVRVPHNILAGVAIGCVPEKQAKVGFSLAKGRQNSRRERMARKHWVWRVSCCH